MKLLQVIFESDKININLITNVMFSILSLLLKN